MKLLVKSVMFGQVFCIFLNKESSYSYDFCIIRVLQMCSINAFLGNFFPHSKTSNKILPEMKKETILRSNEIDMEYCQERNEIAFRKTMK
jgi:hypothetical protein